MAREVDTSAGRPQLTDEWKDEVVRRILGVARPTCIIMFGSAAAGTMTDDSDVDLLVLEDNGADPREESRRIRAALMDLTVPFDVIVMSTRRFEETKNVIGGIAYPAHKYGQVLYEVT